MPDGGGCAHIEGRIAFLRAELGITEAQAKTWDAFASGYWRSAVDQRARA